MKLTNQEIVNILNALNPFNDKELPILLTYRVIEIEEKLLNEYNIYEKARGKVKSDEELKELLELEREIELETFNKQELIDAGLKISPSQLVILGRLIDG